MDKEQLWQLYDLICQDRGICYIADVPHVILCRIMDFVIRFATHPLYFQTSRISSLRLVCKSFCAAFDAAFTPKIILNNSFFWYLSRKTPYIWSIFARSATQEEWSCLLEESSDTAIAQYCPQSVFWIYLKEWYRKRNLDCQVGNPYNIFLAYGGGWSDATEECLKALRFNDVKWFNAFYPFANKRAPVSFLQGEEYGVSLEVYILYEAANWIRSSIFATACDNGNHLPDIHPLFDYVNAASALQDMLLLLPKFAKVVRTRSGRTLLEDCIEKILRLTADKSHWRKLLEWVEGGELLVTLFFQGLERCCVSISVIDYFTMTTQLLDLSRISLTDYISGMSRLLMERGLIAQKIDL